METRLMTHVVAGYPSMQQTEEIVLAMDRSAAEFIEIQFPFSDTIADGPTIMSANNIALNNGTSTNDCFQLLARLKGKTKAKLLIMTYFNVAFKYGLKEFCAKAESLGVYGLIIPDIPIDEEENEHYLEICQAHNLHPIQVVSPLTSEIRLKKIAQHASGFVYCVSRFGTTGVKEDLSASLEEYFTRLRKYFSLPLALGFGISNKEQVRQALEFADIAVMGSKFIRLVDENPKNHTSEIEKFISDFISV